MATRIHESDGQPVLSYMRVENASLQTCVDCHEMERRAKSASFGDPRFALNAPIGALVVDVPLGPAIASARANTTKAVAVLILIMGAAIFALLRMLSSTGWSALSPEIVWTERDRGLFNYCNRVNMMTAGGVCGLGILKVRNEK